MADTKISALPASTVPLAGTEVLPIVQSSATKQVSIANLTAGRIQTSNGILQGTAATGYNYTANTPAAGMTSQLLNWYEEGTWTPVIAGSTTAGTYELTASLIGTYTRIGRQVTLQCTLNTAASVTGGGVGNLIMKGIPFAKAANTLSYAAVSSGGLGYTAGGTLFVTFGTSASTSDLYFTLSVANTGVAFQSINLIGASKAINFCLTYWV